MTCDHTAKPPFAIARYGGKPGTPAAEHFYHHLYCGGCEAFLGVRWMSDHRPSK